MGWLAIFFAIPSIILMIEAMRSRSSGRLKRGFLVIEKSKDPERFTLYNLRLFLSAFLCVCISLSFITESRPFSSATLNALSSLLFSVLALTVFIEATFYSSVPDAHDAIADRKSHPKSFWYVLTLSAFGFVIALLAFILSIRSLLGFQL